MLGGCGLGGACNHTKAFGRAPFTHQRKASSEGVLGQYPLSMIARTPATCTPIGTLTLTHEKIFSAKN